MTYENECDMIVETARQEVISSHPGSHQSSNDHARIGKTNTGYLVYAMKAKDHMP
jgi:hypothetical protein